MRGLCVRLFVVSLSDRFMENNKLLNILKETGLSDNEASVYLAMLSLGPTTILSLARVTNIKRPTVYLVIESLKQKGLVSINLKGFKKLYVAENPDKLESVLENKTKQFKKHLSEFSAIFNLKESQSTIKYYEGLEAIKNIYDQLLKDIEPGDDYLVLSDAKQWLALDKDYFMDFTERRGMLPIKIRLLMQDSDEAKYLHKFQRNFNYQSKILPKETKLTTNLIITPKRVVINQLTSPVMAIVIENQSIIDMHKEMFEIMWKENNLR